MGVFVLSTVVTSENLKLRMAPAGYAEGLRDRLEELESVIVRQCFHMFPVRFKTRFGAKNETRPT